MPRMIGNWAPNATRTLYYQLKTRSATFLSRISPTYTQQLAINRRRHITTGSHEAKPNKPEAAERSNIPWSEHSGGNAFISWNYKFDVVIAGTGAAALSAAITASQAGLVPLLVEASRKWGGTTAKSAGGMWVPDHPLMRDAGIEDSPSAALSYLDALIGDVGPSSSLLRRQKYMEAGPKMFQSLKEAGFAWTFAQDYPDYHSEYSGSRTGRALEAAPFDMNLLGPWKESMMQRDIYPTIPLTVSEAQKMLHASRTWAGINKVIQLSRRLVTSRIKRESLSTMGMAITAQLMYIVQKRGISVWMETPLCDLVVQDGRVLGAIIERGGRKGRVEAPRGVLLASGGFSKNDSIRQEYGQAGKAEWSIANPNDKGTALQLGVKYGAEVALMDQSWWVPLIRPPGEPAIFTVWERTVPHSIMVNEEGKRFCNEAASYQDVGWKIIQQDMPTWLIFDSIHRRKYNFGSAMPGITPRRYLNDDFMIQAPTLSQLAAKCGIDSEQLRKTIDRFNGFAATGIDPEFNRGATQYDRYYADPTHKPNPSLGSVGKPPFYAVPVYPGDVGSKGGLLIDENSRVVSKKGSPIPGFYAAGNASASLFGMRYPGPGGTLGPAMVGGYLSMRHAAQEQ